MNEPELGTKIIDIKSASQLNTLIGTHQNVEVNWNSVNYRRLNPQRFLPGDAAAAYAPFATSDVFTGKLPDVTNMTAGVQEIQKYINDPNSVVFTAKESNQVIGTIIGSKANNTIDISNSSSGVDPDSVIASTVVAEFINNTWNSPNNAIQVIGTYPRDSTFANLDQQKIEEIVTRRNLDNKVVATKTYLQADGKTKTNEDAAVFVRWTFSKVTDTKVLEAQTQPLINLPEQNKLEVNGLSATIKNEGTLIDFSSNTFSPTNSPSSEKQQNISANNKLATLVARCKQERYNNAIIYGELEPGTIPSDLSEIELTLALKNQNIHESDWEPFIFALHRREGQPPTYVVPTEEDKVIIGFFPPDKIPKGLRGFKELKNSPITIKTAGSTRLPALLVQKTAVNLNTTTESPSAPSEDKGFDILDLKNYKGDLNKLALELASLELNFKNGIDANPADVEVRSFDIAQHLREEQWNLQTNQKSRYQHNLIYQNGKLKGALISAPRDSNSDTRAQLDSIGFDYSFYKNPANQELIDGIVEEFIKDVGKKGYKTLTMRLPDRFENKMDTLAKSEMFKSVDKQIVSETLPESPQIPKYNYDEYAKITNLLTSKILKPVQKDILTFKEKYENLPNNKIPDIEQERINSVYDQIDAIKKLKPTVLTDIDLIAHKWRLQKETGEFNPNNLTQTDYENFNITPEKIKLFQKAQHDYLNILMSNLNIFSPNPYDPNVSDQERSILQTMINEKVISSNIPSLSKTAIQEISYTINY